MINIDLKGHSPRDILENNFEKLLKISSQVPVMESCRPQTLLKEDSIVSFPVEYFSKQVFYKKVTAIPEIWSNK